MLLGLLSFSVAFSGEAVRLVGEVVLMSRGERGLVGEVEAEAEVMVVDKQGGE